jgi:clan AA aspartic protease
MGAVMTEMKLWNYTDLEDLRRGLIPPQAVRTVSVEALVDTGAVTLVIPEDVAKALGLSILQVRTVTLADGTTRDIPIMGGLRIEILGRQMMCDAYVTPSGSTPLIGQIPLEYLDLIVDPGTREVRVRSEEGPRAFLLRAAA